MVTYPEASNAKRRVKSHFASRIPLLLPTGGLALLATRTMRCRGVQLSICKLLNSRPGTQGRLRDFPNSYYKCRIQGLAFQRLSSLASLFNHGSYPALLQLLTNVAISLGFGSMSATSRSSSLSRRVSSLLSSLLYLKDYEHSINGAYSSS